MNHFNTLNKLSWFFINAMILTNRALELSILTVSVFSLIYRGLSCAWLEVTVCLSCLSQVFSTRLLSPLLTHLESQEANVKSSLTYVTLWHNLSWLANFGKFYFAKTFPDSSGKLDWNICLRYQNDRLLYKISTTYNWLNHIWSYYHFIRLLQLIQFYNRKRSMAGLNHSYQIISSFMHIIHLYTKYIIGF